MQTNYATMEHFLFHICFCTCAPKVSYIKGPHSRKKRNWGNKAADVLIVMGVKGQRCTRYPELLALSSLLLALCSVDWGALQETPDGRYLILAPGLSFPPGSGFWKLCIICVERLVVLSVSRKPVWKSLAGAQKTIFSKSFTDKLLSFSTVINQSVKYNHTPQRVVFMEIQLLVSLFWSYF